MIDFDVWWNSAAADEFRAKHEDMDGIKSDTWYSLNEKGEFIEA